MFSSAIPTFMLRICRLLCFFYLVSTAAVAQTEPPVHGSVILMYHRFGEDQFPATNVRMEQMLAQLGYLERNGYRFLSLDEIITARRQGKALPARSVAITIDDAYLSVYEKAFPLFRQRGIPFTVFVSTQNVDRQYAAYMNWEQMREMARAGVSFGNHSFSHPHLIEKKAGETDSVWRQRVRQEIRRAGERLHRELGIKPKYFAYPYGEYSLAVMEIVKEEGYMGFGQQSGAFGYGSDLLTIPRFPIAEAFADLDSFGEKIRSLAMPIERVTPAEAIITDGSRPSMEITLAQPLPRPDELRCYASGQGSMTPQWLNAEKTRFRVQAAKPFHSRRGRYNCTAPSERAGRYYWFSHLWIQPARDEE